MKRLILALICAGTMGLPALGQTMDARITTSLEAQGYRIVTMYHTWLGRIYVIAESDAVRREMVFNPVTGEVLRDYAVTRGPVTVARESADPAPAGTSVTDPAAALTTITREEGDADTAPDVVVVDPVIVPLVE